jgi:hypothetical protein
MTSLIDTAAFPTRSAVYRKPISCGLGSCLTTAWRRWMAALIKVVARFNGIEEQISRKHIRRLVVVSPLSSGEIRASRKAGVGRQWTALFRRARRRFGARSSSMRCTMRCWVGSVLPETCCDTPRAGSHQANSKGIANRHGGGCYREDGISIWFATLRILIRPPCDPRRSAPSRNVRTSLSSGKRKPANACMWIRMARGGFRCQNGNTTISKRKWPKSVEIGGFPRISASSRDSNPKALPSKPLNSRVLPEHNLYGGTCRGNCLPPGLAA